MVKVMMNRMKQDNKAYGNDFIPIVKMKKQNNIQKIEKRNRETFKKQNHAIGAATRTGPQKTCARRLKEPAIIAGEKPLCERVCKPKQVMKSHLKEPVKQTDDEYEPTQLIKSIHQIQKNQRPHKNKTQNRQKKPT